MLVTTQNLSHFCPTLFCPIRYLINVFDIRRKYVCKNTMLHIRVVIVSIRVDVVAKTVDEIYILSIIKILQIKKWLDNVYQSYVFFFICFCFWLFIYINFTLSKLCSVIPQLSQNRLRVRYKCLSTSEIQPFCCLNEMDLGLFKESMFCIFNKHAPIRKK